MRTVLEGVFELLMGACALALTLAEFPEISTSISMSMVSMISSARLMNYVSLFFVGWEYSHCNNAEHQEHETLCFFHLRSAANRNGRRKMSLLIT